MTLPSQGKALYPVHRLTEYTIRTPQFSKKTALKFDFYIETYVRLCYNNTRKTGRRPARGTKERRDIGIIPGGIRSHRQPYRRTVRSPDPGAFLPPLRAGGRTGDRAGGRHRPGVSGCPVRPVRGILPPEPGGGTGPVRESTAPGGSGLRGGRGVRLCRRRAAKPGV